MGGKMLKKILPVAFCGVLCFSSVVGLVNAGSWQETLTVPAEFEKVDYVDSGKLFWLQRPKEKHPKQFMNLSGKVVTLPDGTERGGTKDDLGIPTIYNGADNFPGNSNYSVVQFALSGKRSSQGLMDLETGKTIMPLGEYKDLTVYRDGYVTTGNWEKMSIYKNGQLLKADLKKAGRYYPLKDTWYSFDGKDGLKLLNSQGEVIKELPHLKTLLFSGSDIFAGESNGKDGKPKGYRVWNASLEEIMLGNAEPFKDLLSLRKTQTEDGSDVKILEGLLGRKKEGWAFYPYLGNQNFGEAIPVAAKRKEYLSAREVLPGFYRLGRPIKEGDELLDLKNAQVLTTVNDFAHPENKHWYLETWETGGFYMPLFIPGGNWWFGGFGKINTGTDHKVSIKDSSGDEILKLTESVFFGKSLLINREFNRTRVYDYEGNLIRKVDEGYFPVTGQTIVPPEVEGQPRKMPETVFKNWPGAGRYQPYYMYGNWGIFDMETGKDRISSEPRFGQIVTVSEDGSKFWSYFTENGLTGIRQFEWID